MDVLEPVVLWWRRCWPGGAEATLVKELVPAPSPRSAYVKPVGEPGGFRRSILPRRGSGGGLPKVSDFKD